jgi:hypothetical protein
MTRPLLLLLLLVPGSLPAQEKVPYSSLRASVTRLRFYPSGKDFFLSAERVYRTAFDSATVQYINYELGLEYPRTAAALGFSLAMDWKIEAGWTRSKHTGGWGASTGSWWPTGAYTVTCRDGLTEVASGRFDVTSNRHDIPAIQGMVTRVRVLESPRRLLPVQERVYPEAFDSAAVRYMSTEIHLDFPPAKTPATFSLDCTYKYPNGETRNFLLGGRVDTGWKDSMHTGGWGDDEPGGWAKGTYEVTCRHQDREIVQRTFQIR